MLRDNGAARLNVVPNPAMSADDAFLHAVQSAAAADFTVLGEIGRGNDGVIIYLARDMETSRLVALRLQREGQLADEFTLEVVRQLDNSMPAPESRCFKCGKTIRGWARFCSYCGADLSGAASGGDDDSATMLEAVKEAVAGDYEVLGQMSRSEGGGAVYFARDRQSNRIVALRLQREGSGEEFSVGLTSALKPLAASLGVKPVATQLFGQVVAPPATPPPLPAGSQAPAPPPPSVMPAPPPPPLRARRTLTRRTKLLLAAGAAALVVLIVVIVTLPPSRASTALPPPAAADSVSTAPVPPAATTPPPVAPPPVAPAPPPAPRAAAPVAQHNATVLVSGLPADAEIHVDGHPRAGHSFTVAPGTHVFSVTTAGYLARTDTLQLRAGETRAWSPSLAAAPAHSASAKSPPPPPPSPGHVGSDAAAKNAASATACQQDSDARKWTEAAEACTAGAMAGVPAAERNLASLYDHGRGVHGSDQDAVRWYIAAATSGDRESMYQVGIDYEHGHGVKKDESAAALWYARAADAGHALAQFTLGEAYEKGHLGLVRDKAKALEWYRKAAAQGNKDAADKVHDLSK